ncbi:MAG: alanyl-tRNA editing protein, partial [Hyphomicrobiales bacterium]|nr:alanyl-tRNA editing protein [Hyphomicrobiales bacterium]
MTEPLFREAPYRRELEARVVAARPEGVVLDATIFYARGGGQSGDRGHFRRADGSALEIVDTIYDADRRTILHVPAEGALLPAAGETLIAELDWELRYRRMRAHTALHLLSVVLPYPVT